MTRRSLGGSEKTQARGVNPSWPRVLRYCAECGIEHLAKSCPVKMAEKPFNPTSLGIIEVIPSPASLENESKPISLLAVNNIPVQKTKKTMDKISLTKQERPLLQELTGEEQQDVRKKLNAQMENKIGPSSGMDSDTGS